jgi:tetratricopeptide (TPR) repeat protein
MADQPRPESQEIYDPDKPHLGAAAWVLRLNQKSDAQTSAAQRLDELYAAGDWNAALTAASDLIDASPGEARPYLLRGMVYVQQEKMDEALADYGKAIEIQPDLVDAYVQRGRARYGMEDTDGSIADFKQAIKLNPQHAPAYLERGYAFFSKGAVDAALSDFKNYCRLAPDDPIGFNNQAFLLMWMGRTSAAEAAWGKATHLPNPPHWAHSGHAIALYRMKKRRQAIEQYRKAVEIDPRWRDNVAEVAEEYSWPQSMVDVAEEIVTRLDSGE